MRVWFRPHIAGEHWTVYLVSKNSRHLVDDDKDRGPCSGVCSYDKCKIYINQDLDSEARVHATLHELVHALMHVSGADKVYEGDAKKDEDLVTMFTPALHRLLKDLGFHFPGLCT